MPLVSGAGHYVGDPVPVAALDAVVVHPRTLWPVR